LPHHKRRKGQAKTADSREARRAVPMHQRPATTSPDNILIYNDKECPRTGQENAGRFRFARTLAETDSRP